MFGMRAATILLHGNKSWLNFVLIGQLYRPYECRRVTRPHVSPQLCCKEVLFNGVCVNCVMTCNQVGHSETIIVILMRWR